MATATDFIEFVIILIGSYFILVGKFLKILFNPFSKDRNNRRNIVKEPRVTRGCIASQDYIDNPFSLQGYKFCN